MEWNYCGNKRRNKESRLKYLKSHWKQSFTKETTYVVTRELAQAYHLDLTQQNLYVVTSF